MNASGRLQRTTETLQGKASNNKTKKNPGNQNRNDLKTA